MQVLPQNRVFKVINSLVEKKLLTVEEKLQGHYKPKTALFVSLHPAFESESQLQAVWHKLKKAPRQADILRTFLLKAGSDKNLPSPQFALRKSELLKLSGGADTSLRGLTTKKILRIFKQETDRISNKPQAVQEINALTGEQQQAYQDILQQFADKPAVLLYGVTSSGKTEVYMHLIRYYLNSGMQVLYLLPEIALTSQIIMRLKNVFGNQVGVYHSKFNDSERVEIWRNLQSADPEKQYRVILGVRSSVFLPFDNLGLIIVDEEHENTYKQYDPAPRYHARDVSLVLAQIHGAKVLLGTATPSLESYYNAQRGKYGLVTLKSRYKDIQMPRILTADLRAARRTKQHKSLFTPVLLNHMEQALKEGEQVILFKNRRGFSPFLLCRNCGWVPKCRFCDVSLTYHRSTNMLSCHYCGYAIHIPSRCPQCRSTALEMKGYGTERIEEDLSIYFPDARLARMDLDSTRSKNAYSQIIHAFEAGEIDILVGTQMVTKGLDFDNVRIVGILDADSLLNFPDFRAFERSFQLMMQVSGRAGRKEKQGKVIIQTYDKQHPVIQDVVSYNFEHLYSHQMGERKVFHYPPYYRLVKVSVKHKEQKRAEDAAKRLTHYLKQFFGQRVLGPQPPLIARIQNYYIQEMLIKLERSMPVYDSRRQIRQAIGYLQQNPGMKGIRVAVDADPN